MKERKFWGWGYEDELLSEEEENNIDKRIARHLSKDKNLHWHIDYLLANEQTNIIKVTKSELRECDLNTDVKGKIIVEGFGNSDCKENCKSHLKFLS